MWAIFWLLLPLAALSGWYIGRRAPPCQPGALRMSGALTDYYAGLNYLVNEQPDQAIDAFIRMLDLSPESVETTLALGNLFRRRGEVDKAIHIHQGLIARPTLTRAQRNQSVLQLGQDYLSAGVYDRAEHLFQELASGEHQESIQSLHHLIWIYEREKDWDKAIHAAEALDRRTGPSMAKQIAQYYCEKAEIARAGTKTREIERCIKKALAHDASCVRASILLGQLEEGRSHYRLALRAYQQIPHQDESFLPEVIQSICDCFLALDQGQHLHKYLDTLLKNRPCISVVLAKAHYLQDQGFELEAANFVAHYLRQHPSIRGLQHLIDHHLLAIGGPARNDLLMLQSLMARLLSQKPVYRCLVCGFSSKCLHWQCPSCHQWTVLKPIQGLEGE